MTVEIHEVEGETALEAARSLFKEYAASLSVELDFQDFDAELAGLPGSYARPLGSMIVAWRGERAVACVAVRPLDAPHLAELKRLYVRPEARGENLGERLSNAAIAFARGAGYSAIRLDTLPEMGPAQTLYERLGFVEIEAYRFNPVEGTRYMELELQDQVGGSTVWPNST